LESRTTPHRWFAFRPILNQPGAFDDSVNKSQALYGLYATLAAENIAPVKVDLYWLGYERDQGQFGAVQGQERRHSFGTRILVLQRAGTGTWKLYSRLAMLD
jgi:hypothetical protein